MSLDRNAQARIAVLLPVYNAENYIVPAIQSVLAQTFADFELVVIDDGSTDHTAKVLARFSDPRIRIIRQEQNAGLVTALNTGIKCTRSEFIARMDADDICRPRRFERQVAFLEAHPDVSICGTWYRTFGARKRAVRLPVKPEEIRARMFFSWSMGHPTIMMRRSFLEQHALFYDEEFRNCEDFDFLARAAELTRLATLPEFLLDYRVHDDQVTVLRHAEMKEKSNLVRLRQLRTLIPDVTSEQEALHCALTNGVVSPTALRSAEAWLLHLERANRERGWYDSRFFRCGLQDWWYRVHRILPAHPGISILISYWRSPLASFDGIGFRGHGALVAKAVSLSLWTTYRKRSGADQA